MTTVKTIGIIGQTPSWVREAFEKEAMSRFHIIDRSKFLFPPCRVDSIVRTDIQPTPREDHLIARTIMPLHITREINFPDYMDEEKLLQKIKTEKDKRRRGRVWRKIKRMRKMSKALQKLADAYKDKMFSTFLNEDSQ